LLIPESASHNSEPKYTFCARIIAKCAFITILVAAVGCQREKLPTVTGPESTTLVSKVSGTIVTEENSDSGVTRLAILHLPELKKTSLTPVTVGSGQIITDVSGPDENATIAYVHATLDKHFLKTIRVDGADDEIIFERSGGFADTGLQDLAMAPKGGRVAFLTNKGIQDGVQLKNPSAYLTIGFLEVWDTRKREALKIPSIRAVSTWSTPFLAWFPDGERLAYVDLVSKDQVELPGAELAEFTTAYPGWERVPVVTVLDTRTGTKSAIHSGFAPVVSSDGKQVLVQFSNDWMMMVDAVTRRPRAVRLPGAYSFAFAVPAQNLFLYWGLPTQGTPPAYSPYGSFRAGLQMVSIKLADSDTGKFQSIVYPVDPRHSASFGRH
jgi:hypothetical protein